MKKLLIIFFALLVFSISDSVMAMDYTIVKENAGPNGYKYIDENHDVSSATLHCYDPGENECAWNIQQNDIITSSGNQYTIQQIQSMVEAQIQNNNLKGSFYLDGDQSILVSWNGTDVGTYTMTVNDNQGQ
jgi:hypothetical protein